MAKQEYFATNGAPENLDQDLIDDAMGSIAMVSHHLYLFCSQNNG